MTTGHTDVGAYSLGLLEERDRAAFEAHLADCASCAAELAELSPMKALLRGVEPAGTRGDEPGDRALLSPLSPGGTTPPEGNITELIGRRAARERRRRRRQVTLGAAAAVVLIGGGIGAGIALAPQSGGTPPPALALAGQRHSGIDPVTGVAGTVGLVAKGWGTQVTLDLSKVPGPVECQLVAVSRTGERRVVMGWLVPAPGDGVPGHPAHLIIQGGTSISRGDLARVDVNVVNGRTLLSIAV